MVARRPAGVASGQVALRIVQEVEKVRVWATPTKRIRVFVPAACKMTDLPGDFWIEGIEGSASQHDVVFELSAVRGQTVEIPILPDRAALTVLQFASVSWIGRNNSLTDDNALDPDPLHTGSRTVFPDARTVAAGARDQVTVQVSLRVPPPKDLEVFLRSFDADDPAPLAPDVDPNDDGSRGIYRNATIPYTAEEDNPGSLGEENGRIDGEDASAVAPLVIPARLQAEETGLQVTKQPGDNFGIAAVCDRDFALQLRNRDHVDQVRIVRSQQRNRNS